MCGIIVSSLKVSDDACKFISKRGPDYKNEIIFDNINFIHFLLHLTGNITYQPLIQDNIVCIFNGEIYNYKEILSTAPSDSYSIIEAYKKYDEDFVKYLDGEFAIVLLDFNKQKLFMVTDIFKTKPLFYNINKDIIISSYESTCKEIKEQSYISMGPNEVIIYDLKTRKFLKSYSVNKFDLKQYKQNYDDYIKAFEKAVLKRYPEKSIPMVTLSSGVDSGAIACCLNKYKKDVLYLTIPKNEDMKIINERKEILGDSYILLDLTDEEKSYWKKDLEINCEPFIWDWKYNPNVNSIDNGFDMGSMLGKSKLLDFTKKYDPNIRISYSGIGADEIMAHNSFYSRGYGNVDKFPQDLSKVYPWANFFYGSMQNYLKGDEYVGGCYSFETRYPFCDKDVVQEFLWLHQDLKNSYKFSNYKPALLYYLDNEDFPFHVKKYGFNV
jgi:asparagine synthetase B (glutamine-hydrolysing)